MHRIHIVLLLFFSSFYYSCAVKGETLWRYLQNHQTSVELMDVTPGLEHFFLIGVKAVVIPWNTGSTPDLDSIVPPLHRRILFVQKLNNSEQNVVWHREYANLPDVKEVYSSAVTADQQLCVIYGGESQLEAAINPLVLRLNSQGESLWYKPVFAPPESTDSVFLPSEQIANLDAINVVATSNNACLVALITRSVQSQSETFRLHLLRYDSQGNINWHKALPTDLYGTTYLATDHPTSRHFVVTTNLSRDAALEAMILGQPFTPKNHITVVDHNGQLLRNVDLPETFGGVWLHGAVSAPGDSLVVIGKKGSAWLARLQSDGELLSEPASNRHAKPSVAYQAIAALGNESFVVAHDGRVSLFDRNLSLKTTYYINDIAIQTFDNPLLSSQLPADLAVEKIIHLTANHYLLFFEYGSRIVEIALANNP